MMKFLQFLTTRMISLRLDPSQGPRARGIPGVPGVPGVGSWISEVDNYIPGAASEVGEVGGIQGPMGWESFAVSWDETNPDPWCWNIYLQNWVIFRVNV